MNPGQFDLGTARECIGDAAARAIEQMARKDAERGKCEPPPIDGETYWGQVQASMRRSVYMAQYERRLARIARKK